MTEPTRTPVAGDERVAALQAEAKRLATTYDPYGSYYPDIDIAVRTLCDLAGWTVDLLSAATPPPSKDEPEWRSLLSMARLTAKKPHPVDRFTIIEATVEDLRREVAKAAVELSALVANVERRRGEVSA